MTLDPKTSMWVNVALAIVGGLVVIDQSLTQFLGSTPAGTGLAAAAVVLGTLNTILHGLSSAVAGPLAGATNQGA